MWLSESKLEFEVAGRRVSVDTWSEVFRNKKGDQVSLSTPGIYGYLRLGFPVPPYSFIEGVHRTNPMFGTDLRLLEKRIGPSHESTCSMPDMERVERALETELLSRLKNKKIGLSLSAGKDSTFLLALFRSLGIENVTTFTYFTENTRREAFIAAAAAKRAGFKHVLIEGNAEREVDLLTGALSGIPIISGDYSALASLSIADAASREGVDLLVDGLGADIYVGIETEWKRKCAYYIAHLSKGFSHYGEGSHRELDIQMRCALDSEPWERLLPGVGLERKSLTNLFTHEAAAQWRHIAEQVSSRNLGEVRRKVVTLFEVGSSMDKVRWACDVFQLEPVFPLAGPAFGALCADNDGCDWFNPKGARKKFMTDYVCKHGFQTEYNTRRKGSLLSMQREIAECLFERLGPEKIRKRIQSVLDGDLELEPRCETQKYLLGMLAMFVGQIGESGRLNGSTLAI